MVQRRTAGVGPWETVLTEALPLEEPVLPDGFDPDFPILPMVQYEYRTITFTLAGTPFSAMFSQVLKWPVVSGSTMRDTVLLAA